MVVVSHLSLFLGDKFRGRCDSRESHLPLFKTIYFPIAPLQFFFLLMALSYTYPPKISRVCPSKISIFFKYFCEL